jgi:hypothetical protein
MRALFIGLHGKVDSLRARTSDLDVGSKIVAMEGLWNQAVKLKDLKAVDTILEGNSVTRRACEKTGV